MNREHFVKRRKHPTYLARVAERKRAGRSGAGNPCFRPSNEASKADLAEYHREEMGLRRSHQRQRTATVRLVPTASIATGNRHGGEHEHKREIARHVRQGAAR